MSTLSLDDLRALLRAKMLEKGKGAQAQPYSAAAREIGCAHSALLAFLSGGGVSVEMSLRLAAYLEQPNRLVLEMAGHADVADLLSESRRVTSPYAVEIANLLRQLTPKQQRALVAYIRAMVSEGL